MTEQLNNNKMDKQNPNSTSLREILSLLAREKKLSSSMDP